jgi:hypothetical protein
MAALRDQFNPPSRAVATAPQVFDLIGEAVGIRTREALEPQ